MNLNQVLQLPEVSGLTDQQVVDYGNIQIPQSSQEMWKWSRVVSDARFGKALADTLYGAIQSTNGLPAATVYLTDGIDLSRAESQVGLDAIAVLIPSIADQCKQLKLLGVWSIDRWTLWGVPDTTLDQITATRLKLINEQSWAKMITLFNQFAADQTQPVANFQAAVAAFVG